MEVSLELPIAVCKQFSMFSVEFAIQNPESVERPAKDSTRATIVTVLMKKVKLRGRPTNNDLVKNNARPTVQRLDWLPCRKDYILGWLCNWTYRRKICGLLDKSVVTNNKLSRYKLSKKENWECILTSCLIFSRNHGCLSSVDFKITLTHSLKQAKKNATHLKECSTMTQEMQKSISMFNSDKVTIHIRKGCTGTWYFYKNYILKAISLKNHIECWSFSDSIK